MGVMVCEGAQLAENFDELREADKKFAEYNNDAYTREYQLTHDPEHPLCSPRIGAQDVRSLNKEVVALGICPVPKEIFNLDGKPLSELLPGFNTMQGGKDVSHHDAPASAGSKPVIPPQR